MCLLTLQCRYCTATWDMYLLCCNERYTVCVCNCPYVLRLQLLICRDQNKTMSLAPKGNAILCFICAYTNYFLVCLVLVCNYNSQNQRFLHFLILYDYTCIKWTLFIPCTIFFQMSLFLLHQNLCTNIKEIVLFSSISTVW